MKVRLFILAVLLSCISSKCKKDDDIYKNPTDEAHGELLTWKNYLADNKFEAYSINPSLNSQNNILMSSLFNPDGREIFKLFDGETGKVLWTWDDYLRDEEFFMGNSHLVFNDVMVLCAHNATYAFDIVTGQTLWKHFMDPGYGPGSPFIHLGFDGFVYHSFYGEEGDFKNYILKTKYNSLNWEQVCVFIDSTSSYPRIYSDGLVFDKSASGDELVYFHTLLANGLTDVKTKLSCYNLSKNRYEWQKDYSSLFNDWGAPQMKIINNKLIAFAYYGQEYNVIAVDITDGSMEWKISMPGFAVELLDYNGKAIVFCSAKSPVRSIDVTDGSIIWEQKFNQQEIASINFAYGDVTLFKNYLFSTECDNLLVLNADNGSIVYNKKVAIEDGCLQYGVAINEKDRTFYVQDRKYICCYKLPAEVKY